MASQYSCVYLTKKEDGFMVHRGLAEKDGSIVIQMSGRKIIVVDRERKAFLRLFIIDYLKERMTVDVKQKNLSAIEHNQILDLSDEGDRWGGDVWNDQPYGWGVLYDKDSNIAYEGFRMGDRNVCYGTEYYSDIGVINYRGGYFDGMRWGRGTHYDRNGSVVFEGNWMEDDTKFERSMRVDMNKQEEISFQNSIEVLEFCESRNERLEWQEPFFAAISDAARVGHPQQLLPQSRELQADRVFGTGESGDWDRVLCEEQVPNSGLPGPEPSGLHKELSQAEGAEDWVLVVCGLHCVRDREGGRAGGDRDGRDREG